MEYYIYRNPEFNKVGCTNNPEKRMETEQGLAPYMDYVIKITDNKLEASHLEAYYKGFYKAKWDKDIYYKLTTPNQMDDTTDFYGPRPVSFHKGADDRYYNVDWISKRSFVSKVRDGVIFYDGEETFFAPEELDRLEKLAQSSQYNSGIYFVPKAVKLLRSKLDEENAERRMDIIGQNGNTGEHYESNINNPDNVVSTRSLYPGDILVAEHQQIISNPCPDFIEDETNGLCHGTYIEKIRGWATERGLYEKGDPKTQYIKLQEEAGEVARAIIKNDLPEIKDGLGDIFVVLVNLAHLAGFTLEECIEQAWNEIKDRKGGMKNGSFVKE